MRLGLSLVSAANPNGIGIYQPGVARNELRWVNVRYIIYPEGLNPTRASHIIRSMSQSLSKILVHTVFSTKDRRPFLRDKPLRNELHHYIGGILTNLNCQPIKVGGVEDHVHFLCALSRACTAADMVKETKRGSSLWIKTKSKNLQDFAWQEGYGIFSIGFSQIELVKEYIDGQEEHHIKILFQEEFRQLLKRYGIEFGERYVWA